MPTTTKGIPYPDDASGFDPSGDFQAIAERIDEVTAKSVTTAERDALAGNDLWVGRVVYNTDTEEPEFWNGASWESMVISGASIGLVIALS